MFYIEKRIEAAEVGTRFVAVRCDRCECEYFYELARMGTGCAIAPYGVLASSASNSAREQSERDLRTRLADEAELVPCPKCHWINDELVDGFRRGRYRGWTRFAGCVAFFGTVGSWICAWYVSIGPPGDRVAVPFFLYYGPLICILSGGAILGLRHLLRGRIQPNANFPEPPRLPRGCPAALVQNSKTGDLEVAANPEDADLAADEWIEFQVGRFKLPLICCECLTPVIEMDVYKVQLTEALNLPVPHCKTCAIQLSRRQFKMGFKISALMMGIGVGMLYLLGLSREVFWISFFILCLLAPLTGAAIGHHKTMPAEGKPVDKSRGIFRVWFRNPGFRKRVRNAVELSHGE